MLARNLADSRQEDVGAGRGRARKRERERDEDKNRRGVDGSRDRRCVFNSETSSN